MQAVEVDYSEVNDGSFLDYIDQRTRMRSGGHMIADISSSLTHSGGSNGFLRVEEENSYYKFRPDHPQREQLPQGIEVNRRPKGPLQLSIDKLYRSNAQSQPLASEQ